MQIKTLVSPLLVAVALSACGGGSDGTATDNTNTTTHLSIPFQAKAGTVDIACGSPLAALGLSADSGTVADFAFYVHDIQLKTSTGQSVAVKLDKNDFQDPEFGVALLDFQDKVDSCQGAAKPTNRQVYGAVSGIDPATVTGIEFKVGIPAAVNHHNASTAVAPYNRSGLFWKWQTGHKFMRLDINPARKVQLAYDNAGQNTANTYFFHLGSTGCQGDPTTGAVVSCMAGNRPQVSLSQGFKLQNLTTSPVVFDYAQLVKAINLNTDAVAPSGCMSGLADVECGSMFKALGLSFGAQPSQLQSVFRIGQ